MLKIRARDIAIAGCLAVWLSGCATPTYNYRPLTVDISDPPLGEIRVAKVGDNLLRQGKFQERDALRLEQSVRVGTIGTYTFLPGHYVKTGENSSGEFFDASTEPGSGRVEVGALADPFEALLAPKGQDGLCGVSTLGGKVCNKLAQFTRLKLPVASADAFQQSLLYSGKVGNKINIGYREFAGNTARPAFNNDVEYDLSESRIIGYKGAEIEVLDANNREIRYRVIRNFNAAVN